MLDLISNEDRERFMNQLEDTAGTFSSNLEEEQSKLEKLIF